MGATWAWLFLASLSQLPGAAGAASSVKAFAEGYASGEVSTASSFLFGTASAFVTADPCIGIASGISLFRDDTAATGELHDIALWYSPNEALFHASVTRTLSSTREEVSAFTGSGWAAADPTLTGMELAIEWSAGSVRFMVDGVVIATTVPILGSLAAAPTLTFAPTEPEDVAAFAKPHSLHVFSIAARDPKPAAACLPSTSAFVGVKFTGAALNFEVTDWPANLASGAWIVGKGSDYRGSTPAFSPYAVLVPESVAGSGATLRITTGFTMYTSQEGADTDPDLLAYPDQPNATLWRVTADAHAAATAMVSPAAGGELIVSVSAAGVNESSITAGREMVVPAGEVLCSVARIRCDFARNVSMAVTARGTQAPSYFPAPVYTINTAPGAWQLFNTCYVFSAEETVEVIAWLGTYNAVTEYIYYRVEIDFLYTLRVALDTASDAWSGLRLVEKSWRLTENPTTPYYPWSGGTVENDAWTYTLINSNDFYQGEVQMVANAQGEGRLTRHALAISKGKTYRVSVTARMTNTDNANPRRVFVSMQSDLGTDTYGGIHQFVVTGVRTTFTYTFECLQSVQAVTLIVHMLPGFSGFSVGDVLVIVDVFLDEFNGNVTHPQDFKIEPTLAEREAGFPPFEGEPLSMGVVQPTSSPSVTALTPTPTRLTPLRSLYDARYVNSIVKVSIPTAKFIPQTFDIDAFRDDLGEILSDLTKASYSSNAIKILKVCSTTEPLALTDYINIEPPRDDVRACRGVAIGDPLWLQELKVNDETLEIHLMLVNLPLSVDANGWNKYEATDNFVNELFHTIRTTGALGRTLMPPGSSVRKYISETTVNSPAPAVLREEGERRSTFRNAFWLAVLFGCCAFCFLLGMLLANVSVNASGGGTGYVVEPDSDDEYDAPPEEGTMMQPLEPDPEPISEHDMTIRQGD